MTSPLAPIPFWSLITNRSIAEWLRSTIDKLESAPRRRPSPMSHAPTTTPDKPKFAGSLVELVTRCEAV